MYKYTYSEIEMCAFRSKRNRLHALGLRLKKTNKKKPPTVACRKKYVATKQKIIYTTLRCNFSVTNSNSHDLRQLWGDTLPFFCPLIWAFKITLLRWTQHWCVFMWMWRLYIIQVLVIMLEIEMQSVPFYDWMSAPDLYMRENHSWYFCIY